MLTNFYLAFAPLSFTLLGLWLVVVQTRHAEWRASAHHRRRAYAVFLHFALPGMMTLLALIDASSSTLWRVAFCVIALAGGAALLTIGYRGWTSIGRTIALDVSYWASLVFYAAIAFVAAFPRTVARIDGLKPLRVEAILLSAVVFLGVNVAWLLLFDEPVLASDD